MIPGPQGQMLLTIPLRKGKNNKCPINRTEIAFDNDWQRIMLESLRSAYGSAPFFDIYYPGIENLIKGIKPFLFQSSLEALNLTFQQLNKKINFELTKEYIKEYPSHVDDLRNSILPRIAYTTGINYAQVFEENQGFIDNCSIIDILMCTGPEASLLLQADD